MQIALDGPAGSGKSTIAKEIAKKLNIIYLDTGAMYRAAALKALSKNIDPNDEIKAPLVLNDVAIEIRYIENIQHVFLDGEDVSEKIRQHHISKAASDISKHKDIRLKLVELQRKIAKGNDVIMDGRDIGSYVLPNADYKFYLTASAEERANRRFKELQEKGENAVYEDILKDILLRDENDTKREFAPLIRVKDAIEIDSTNFTISESVEKILSYIKQC